MLSGVGGDEDVTVELSVAVKDWSWDKDQRTKKNDNYPWTEEQKKSLILRQGTKGA